jgi:hypothetical protein
MLDDGFWDTGSANAKRPLIRLDLPDSGSFYLKTSNFEKRSGLVKSRTEATKFDDLNSAGFWLWLRDERYYIPWDLMVDLYPEGSSLVVEYA